VYVFHYATGPGYYKIGRTEKETGERLAKLSGGSAEVRVEGAKNDARMIHRSVPMQMQEMTAVMRQENTAFGDCEFEDIGVRHRGVCSSRIERGQHIVAQRPEFRDNLQRNVFVGIEAGH
jgi:hypothetical protein